MIANWDGRKWRVLKDPGASGALVSVAAVASGRVWAVGQVDASGFVGSSNGYLDSWDGHRLRHDDDFGVYEDIAAVSSDRVWAVSTSGGIAHWDAQNHLLPGDVGFVSGERHFLAVTATSDADVWAVGYTDKTSLVRHWDGRSWTSITSGQTPNAWLAAAAAATRGDLWAAMSRAKGAGMLMHIVCR